MKTIPVFLLALLMLLPFQASAQTAPNYDALYSACVDEHGPINNAVVEVCSNQVSERAKAEITRHYQAVHARLSAEHPEDAAKFEESQKAWLKYRNSHCSLAGAYVGSPMYGFCPMKLNADRAAELRELSGE